MQKHPDRPNKPAQESVNHALGVEGSISSTPVRRCDQKNTKGVLLVCWCCIRISLFVKFDWLFLSTQFLSTGQKWAPNQHPGNRQRARESTGRLIAFLSPQPGLPSSLHPKFVQFSSFHVSNVKTKIKNHQRPIGNIRKPMEWGHRPTVCWGSHRKCAQGSRPCTVPSCNHPWKQKLVGSSLNNVE